MFLFTANSRIISNLGKAAAGTATILETYTTTGASGEVSQLSTPCSAASKACIGRHQHTETRLLAEAHDLLQADSEEVTCLACGTMQ